MHRLFIAALIAALAACSPPVDTTQGQDIPEPPMTAAHLADLIAADGASHTVAVLTGPAAPNGLDPVFAGIATGDPGWLAVAPLLRPEVDGVYADGLADALSRALPINPEGVLTALNASGGASERTCEATDDPTVIAAVEGVADPALRTVKVECLGYLRAG
ncbi:hypothetical protein [Brevundimonas subvibrioides]|uniref:hypothetical protein n=1 Tax=Brevundimonas subvibrioides TaxID=74313 RepID=UPI0022B5C72E|nr:hypothetical protein [Brevundimonas subvibrioides]